MILTFLALYSKIVQQILHKIQSIEAFWELGLVAKFNSCNFLLYKKETKGKVS